MKSTIEMVRMLVSAQALVTALLAALLWSLYARLRRQEFDRWWASAWTLSALHLGLGRVILGLPRGSSPGRGIGILTMTALGFLVAPALIFGAMSLRAPRTITRRMIVAGLTTALVLAAATYAVSVLWAAPGLTRFSVRNLPRCLMLAIALFFSARVFFQRARTTRSWAALVTGVSCLLYGINQSLYATAQAYQVFHSSTGAPGAGQWALAYSALLLYMDIALTCGICFGMVLVLLEEYQRSEAELLDSVSRSRAVAQENTAMQSEIRRRRKIEERHQAVLMALPDWVFVMSHDGVYLEFHGRDERNLLMPPRAFIGRNVRDTLPPDLAERMLGCYREALRSDQPATLEYSLKIDDEERYYEVRAVRSDQDRVLCLVRDLTDRKQAEHRAGELQSELAHAGRVMALGTLTGALAHEISQPLAAIQTNAFAAQRMLSADSLDVDEIRSALRDIASDNQRIAEVLRRLRGLLKRDRRDYGPVDVNAVVDDVLMLAHSSLIERRISIRVERGENLPAVFGDRVQLQQVVLNLLMNAADATATVEDADDRRVTVKTGASGGEVSVSVADRGMGVSSAELDQMFDPFFSTKHDGMGLGLSICRTIMDAHGGRIWATRNPDRGLTCSFELDAVTTGAPSIEVPSGQALADERVNA
jgi:PAS domain S-box-containing protein